MRTLLLLCLCGTVSAQDALDRALAGLRTAPHDAREAAVKAVLALQPDAADVVARLAKGVPVTAIGSGWHILAATDEAGVSRPFQLYVPPAVAGKQAPVPLLVHLHGGVSRPAFTQAVGQVGYGRNWVAPADEHGFAVCFPLGRADCVWWSDAGVRAIRAAIRETKRLVPVDDDAIIGTGFSDGASGCYHLAMAAPWPFAGFLPMNGHPAVAASASGKQLYLRNLARSPLFVAMTQDDQLYPAFAVMEHLGLALKEGVRIRFVNWETGSHTPAYWEDQLPAFVSFITDTTRDAFPPDIDWRSADPETAAVAWVEILEFGAAKGEMPADEDLNLMSTPGRVRLGFNVDRAFAGPGVKVTTVLADSTAAKIGMQKGDVVVGLDGVPVAKLNDLIGVLGRKEFGQPVAVTVERGGAQETLRGAIPPFTPAPYYLRAKPTARLVVRADEVGIVVFTRHVKRFRLLLPPETGIGPRFAVNGADRPFAAAPVGLAGLLRRYAREADAGRLFTRTVEIEVAPQ